MPDDLKQHILDIYGRNDIVLALSTGTPGPFRKITAMIMDSDGKVLGYAKIGETPLATSRIKNEAKMLKVMGDRLWVMGKENTGDGSKVIGNRARIRFPELLHEGEIDNGYMLIQSPAPFEGKSGEKYFNEDYGNILETLIDKTAVTGIFIKSEFYKNLREGIDNYSLSYKDTLQNGLRYLEEALGDQEITFALSHGDFAPWNMMWKGKEVFIYDWESANLKAPAGIDLVHFFFQTGFLLKKPRGDKLLSYILQNASLHSIPLPEPAILIMLYSLHMAITEDQPQQLSPTAVERRKMIKLIARR